MRDYPIAGGASAAERYRAAGGDAVADGRSAVLVAFASKGSTAEVGARVAQAEPGMTVRDRLSAGFDPVAGSRLLTVRVRTVCAWCDRLLGDFGEITRRALRGDTSEAVADLARDHVGVLRRRVGRGRGKPPGAVTGLARRVPQDDLQGATVGQGERP